MNISALFIPHLSYKGKGEWNFTFPIRKVGLASEEGNRIAIGTLYLFF
jgi:hypothetical protein